MLSTALMYILYPDFETTREALALVVPRTRPDVTPGCNPYHSSYDRGTYNSSAGAKAGKPKKRQ